MTDVGDWFELTESLVKSGYAVLGSAGPRLNERGGQRVTVMCACLLARSLSNIRGAMILAKAARVVEARAIVRCCFENEFWTAALAAKGEAFVDEMMKDEVRARQASGQFLFDDAQSRQALAPEVEEKVRSWLGQSKKEWPNAASLNPHTVAKGTEISGAYNFYRQLSGDAAHPSLTSLNRYLEEQAGEIVGIDADPLVSTDEIVDTLSLACVALFGVCIGADQILNPGHQPAEFAAAWELYQELAAPNRKAPRKRSTVAEGRYQFGKADP